MAAGNENEAHGSSGTARIIKSNNHLQYHLSHYHHQAIMRGKSIRKTVTIINPPNEGGQEYVRLNTFQRRHSHFTAQRENGDDSYTKTKVHTDQKNKYITILKTTVTAHGRQG